MVAEDEDVGRAARDFRVEVSGQVVVGESTDAVGLEAAILVMLAMIGRDSMLPELESTDATETEVACSDDISAIRARSELG